jgi:hypothetical protein
MSNLPKPAPFARIDVSAFAAHVLNCPTCREHVRTTETEDLDASGDGLCPRGRGLLNEIDQQLAGGIQ